MNEHPTPTDLYRRAVLDRIAGLETAMNTVLGLHLIALVLLVIILVWMP